MKVVAGNSRLSESIARARAAIAVTEEPIWTSARRAGWSDALDEVERFVAGEEQGRGFSILRTLDGTAGVDGAASAAILDVARALRESGIDRFN